MSIRSFFGFKDKENSLDFHERRNERTIAPLIKGDFAPQGISDAAKAINELDAASDLSTPNRTVSLSAVRRHALRSPYAQSFLNLAKTKVIGAQGIRPTLTTIERMNQRAIVKSAWEDFAEDPTVRGDFDFPGFA